MRWGIAVALAALSIFPATATAQAPSGMRSAAGGASSVIRPAGYVWRNYVTVPDGPCGPPMAVQADCYVPCRPCGPLHPLCFLHRVGRMLSCLVPCNHCCHRGGCGLHGCVLGGRWGGCGVCCGQVCDPCCDSGMMGGTTSGGHCIGCGGGGVSDPFQDDPVPTPLPAPQPAPQPSQTRYSAPRPLGTAMRPAAPVGLMVAQSRRPPVGEGVRPSHAPAAYRAPATAPRPTGGGSVLRRTSAEYEEPIRLRPDLRVAAPVVRSQSPDEPETQAIVPTPPLPALPASVAEQGEPIPYNPLRP